MPKEETVQDLVSFEFIVISANEDRIIISDGNGELFQIESEPNGTGDSRLLFYKLTPKMMDVV